LRQLRLKRWVPSHVADNSWCYPSKPQRHERSVVEGIETSPSLYDLDGQLTRGNSPCFQPRSDFIDSPPSKFTIPEDFRDALLGKADLCHSLSCTWSLSAMRFRNA